jgi:hypothetical protein
MRVMVCKLAGGVRSKSSTPSVKTEKMSQVRFACCDGFLLGNEVHSVMCSEPIQQFSTAVQHHFRFIFL